LAVKKSRKLMGMRGFCELLLKMVKGAIRREKEGFGVKGQNRGRSCLRGSQKIGKSEISESYKVQGHLHCKGR
jgi:hypothetical protein